MRSRSDQLGALADRLGVERSYWDTAGEEHFAGDETRAAIVAAMGYDIETDDALAASLAAVEAEQTARLIPPSWCIDEGGWLCFPVRAMSGAFRWEIRLETGGAIENHGRLEELHTYDGEAVASRALLIIDPVPIGMHRLRLETGDRAAEANLIVAPPRCLSVHEATGGDRLWGITAPLYGLRSERNFAIGDFEDIARLAENAAGLGADFLGINPVHALFPELPEQISPYSPSSRSFLNVMHIAPDRVPEFADSADARRFAETRAASLSSDRTQPLVDYTRAAGIKLPIFELLFEAFLKIGADSNRHGLFAAFCAERGERLRRHALFDALSRHFIINGGHRSWMDWPKAYQDPDSPAVAEFASAFERDVLFYSYLQWIADDQLGEAARRASDAGMALGLYLDLAVGVPEGGSDVWASPADYARGVSLGAPPDSFAPDGQRWGLQPYNPPALVRNNHRPFAEMVRAVMRHAGMVRIDHVLGLARSFWMPDGLPGAYVRYPLHELLAIVAIESRRAGTVVIGEDLGSIPDGLRDALAARAVSGCRIAYFERQSNGDFRPPARYPSNVLASISCHDLPTLKGFWRGTDIAWRHRIAATSPETASEARLEQEAARADDRRALCRLVGHDVEEGADPIDDNDAFAAVNDGLHAQLARAPSELVAVESENLLGATEQANLPGTIDEHPNWRRRMSVSVESFHRNEGVLRICEQMRAIRGRD